MKEGVDAISENIVITVWLAYNWWSSEEHDLCILIEISERWEKVKDPNNCQVPK